MGRVLDRYEDGGEEVFHYDEGEQAFSIQYHADVEPVIEHNKARLNDGTGGWNKARDWRHVASIPVWVVMAWIGRFGVDPTAKGNEKLLFRLLNDPEWRWLRVSEGRL